VRPKPEPIRALASHWLRAPMGGILRAEKRLGQFVVKDEILARVSDPFGRHTTDLMVQKSGIIIGRSNLPIVNRGDAAFHIATVDSLDDAEETMTAIEQEVQNDPLFHNTNIV